MPVITVDFVARTGTFVTDFDKLSKTTQRELTKIAKEVRDISERFDVAGKAARQFAEDKKRLDEALKRGVISQREYNKLLAQANPAMQQMTKTAQDLGRALGLMAVAGAGALVALTKESIEAAAQLADMAQKVGVSVESLSTLGYAASQSGVGIEQLQGGLVKLAKNASDAAQGTGTAVDAFNALGISVKKADGSLKGTDVLLREVADQMSRYEDGANKTALAVSIFGRAGAELIPLLNEGADGIEELEQRARDLGIEMDTNTARSAEHFGDVMADIGQLAKGFGNDLARELLPMLNALGEEFVDSGMKAREGSTAAEALADSFKVLIAVGYTVKGAIEALVNTIAAYVDVSTSAGLAANEIAENLNPLTAAIKMANGEFRSFGTIAAEFKDKAAASMISSATGVQDAVDGLSQAYSAIFAVSRPANEEIANTGKQADGAAPSIRNLAKETAGAAKEAKALEKAMRAAWALQDKAVAETVRMAEALDREDEARKQTLERVQEQTRDLENEIRLLGVTGDARDRLAAKIDAERMVRNQNGEAMDEERRGLEKLLIDYQKAAKVDSLIGQFKDTGLSAILEDIADVGEALEDAFDKEHIADLRKALGEFRQEALLFATDAVGKGISSLQSMAQEGTSAYKALEVAQAALNLTTAIGAIANQGLGDPYTAFARIAAMAAMMSQLVGSIGALSGASGPSAARRQETQGTGTVLGDVEAKSESIANAVKITASATSQLVGINQGMLRALNAMQAAIGGASNLLARGAGGTAPTSLSSGASIPSIGGANSHSLFVQAFANIFGGKESLRDTGIRIVGGTLSDMIDDIMVQSYATIHRSGGWFSSSRNFDRTAAIGDEVAVQFQLVLESMADAVREGAEALGMDLEAVNAAIAAFEIEEIRISTMDLSAEEAQAELEAVFASIFDGLAGAVVPFIAQFQQVGEGLGETLVRVATGVQVTQEAITQLGFALDETDPERFAQISEGLIGLVGGIDEFISGMSTFVNAFATEEHKFEVAQDAITRAFAQFGLTIPATRDAMWDLMQSLDATTDEGREQIAMLLRLASTADSYYDMLEEQQEAVNRASEEAAAAAVAAMSSYEDFVRQFDDTNEGLLGGLRGLEDQFKRDLHQANLLAEAAGLKRARLEDLERIEMRYLRAREQMIKDLTQTVIGQIAELYGTSAQQLEAQIADLDTAIAGVFDNMGSGPGFIQAFFREMELQAQRSGLVEQLEAQRATEEALRRQTGALDLAQNLADLSLARGIDFGALAAELGLNLDAFGADLGLTGKGIFELINTLQTESLTSDVFGEGVQQIVDAILQSNGLEESRAENFAKSYAETEMRGTYRDERDDALLEEVRAMRAENAILLSLVATNTGTTATASTEVARIGALDRLQGEASARGGFRQPKPTLERG